MTTPHDTFSQSEPKIESGAIYQPWCPQRLQPARINNRRLYIPHTGHHDAPPRRVAFRVLVLGNTIADRHDMAPRCCRYRSPAARENDATAAGIVVSRAAAAEKLGIPRQSLQKLMKRLEIAEAE